MLQHSDIQNRFWKKYHNAAPYLRYGKQYWYCYNAYQGYAWSATRRSGPRLLCCSMYWTCSVFHQTNLYMSHLLNLYLRLFRFLPKLSMNWANNADRFICIYIINFRVIISVTMFIICSFQEDFFGSSLAPTTCRTSMTI